MGSPSAVRLDGLTKFYGRRLGVQNVSFVVMPGRSWGSSGRTDRARPPCCACWSGCCGPPRAELFGLDVTACGPSVRNRVGYLPGTLSLYRRMTAGSYLSFMERMRGRDCAVRTAQLCERLGVDTPAHIGEMSKGNRQKVGVVQAFMHDPDLLVLDEPTSGLDPVVLKFAGPADPSPLASVLGFALTRTAGNTVEGTVRGSQHKLLSAAVAMGVVAARSPERTLDELFLDLVRGGAR